VREPVAGVADRQASGRLAEWQQAAVVLDVSDDAASLHFGVLLSGAGAVDLGQPRFETVGADVPVTAKPSPPLPDEPQALNFGQPAAT
jgi:AraC family transcriptional regulator